MAYGDDLLTYKDADDVKRNTRSRAESGTHLPGVVLYSGNGAVIATVTDPGGVNCLPVIIKADDAGSSVVTDDESIPRADVKAALAAAINYGADGTAAASGDRKIIYVFGGAQAVIEYGSKGQATATTVTVQYDATNGTQLIAANTAGTGGLRRRVIITQRGATAVEVAPGNITATTGKGRYLPGVPGAEQVWFIQGELRATCAAGSQEVSVSTEIAG